jgi:hypothetical protein
MVNETLIFDNRDAGWPKKREIIHQLGIKVDPDSG